MPGAVILMNQPTGAGPGILGVARRDGWQGRQIELVVGTSGNSSINWSLLSAPLGSAAVLANPDQLTATFTPDVLGTYRIQLVTNGGGPGNVQVLVFRVRYDTNGILAYRGWALPGFGERDGESNYSGNLVAWAEPLEFIFADINEALENATSGNFDDGIVFPFDGTFSITQQDLSGSGAPADAIISAQNAFTDDLEDGGMLTLKGGNPGQNLNHSGAVRVDLGAEDATDSESARLLIRSGGDDFLSIFSRFSGARIEALYSDLVVNSSGSATLSGNNNVQLSSGLHAFNVSNFQGIGVYSSRMFFGVPCQRVPTPTATNVTGTTISIDFNVSGDELEFFLNQASTTMNAPTNIQHGTVYTFKFRQVLANRVLTWNSIFKFGGTSSVLSTASGAIDYFVFKADGTTTLRLLYASKGVHV